LCRGGSVTEAALSVGYESTSAFIGRRRRRRSRPAGKRRLVGKSWNTLDAWGAGREDLSYPGAMVGKGRAGRSANLSGKSEDA
ncbi:hypothetical protein ACOTEJ_28020, partial [Achromobacter xylosoxidans]